MIPALVLAAALALAGPVQSAPPDKAPAQVSPEHLERFVQAFRDVQDIRATALSRMVGEARAARSALREEANLAMREAVLAQGLSLTEYNDLVIAMRTDRALAKRVRQLLVSFPPLWPETAGPPSLDSQTEE